MRRAQKPKFRAPARSASRARQDIVRVRNRDLAALLRIAETATQSLDTDKIINDTLDESLAFLGFDVGFIRIVEREKNGMVVRAARGLRSPQFLEGVTPIDGARRNVSRVVYETREPYLCTDIRRDSIYNNRTMQREGVISTAAAPILSKSRVLGIIVVGSRKPHRFARREIHLLKAFGAQLGAALENASLYEQVNHGKDYIENLVENAGDAIITTDANDTILSWNRAAEVIFGYGKTEVLGQSLAILAPQNHPTELVELRTKVEITGPLRNLEVRRKRKDGTIFNVSLAVSPIRAQDETITGFLYIAKDITEAKQYEQRLRQLDRMKSDFVSNVSHELRTPLTAIKGSVDNMLDGITGAVSEKQTRYLMRIKANADRLGRLINEILDLSRIESGKIDLSPGLLPMMSLTREIAEMLRPVAVEKLISIELGNSAEAVTAWADRDKVTQVLVNLVGNAVKFTPSHGKITIAVDGDAGDWVRVAVRDTGPGIAREEMEKIFDKFYQVAKVSKEKARGAGLGLAISKALVEMHGGRLWIESEVGQGSCFYFTVPAHSPLEGQRSGRMEVGDGT